MAFSKRLRKNRGWIAALMLVAVAGVAWFVTAQASKTEAAQTTYTTEGAAVGTLSVSVSGSGNLELSSERDVWPTTSGTVESIEVALGDSVDKGEVLYVLDSDDAEAATSKAYSSYLQAQSNVTQASAQLSKAESNLADLKEKRTDDDPTTQEVSKADVAAAEADVASAEAQLASARAAQSDALNDYNEAQDAEDELEVTAPISGTVWSLNVEKGDAVSPSTGSSSSTSSSSSSADAATTGSTVSSSASTAPITLAPNKPLVATLAINEVDLPSLKKGQRCDLEFDALPDLAMTGKVTSIAKSGTVSSGVVTFDVTVRLDVVNEQLRPGMTVAASIVTDVARDALVVSNAAVKTDTDGAAYVLVMKGGATSPTQTAVETGLASDTQTQILSGLVEGDLVVTATSDSSSDSSDSEDSGSGGGMMMLGGATGGPPSGGPGGGQ